jgi:2-polyprenyl-6-methoxyphenol hydroxylase-like FAD-dependent oxidoreductase
MRFFRWLGINDELECQAKQRQYHEFWSEYKKLFELDMKRLDSFYQCIFDIAQPKVERILEKACIASGYVKLKRGFEVRSIEQSDHDVTVRANSISDDSEIVVKGHLGIGADGYHSHCRELLQISTQKKDYGTYSLVADFETSTPLDHSRSKIVLDPNRPHGFFPFAENRFRLVLRVNPNETREQVLVPEFLKDQVHRLYGDFEDLELLWASQFRLAQQQSENYVKGRWILAGDAAHAMGPSAGSGMQLGLLGAWRLAWRIAFGLMQPDHLHPLLADYNREHRQTAEQIQFENEIIFRNMAINSTILSTIRNFALQIANALIGLNDRMAASSTLEGLKVNTTQSFDYWILPQIEHLSNFQCWEIGTKPSVEVISQLPTSLTENGLNHILIPLTPSALTKVEEFCQLLKQWRFTVINYFAKQHESDLPAIFTIIRPDSTVVVICKLNI